MQITHISPREAADRMRDGWVYVDVRSEDDFAEGHPAGALNVPFEGGGARFVEAVKSAVGQGARVVVGCRSGVVSVRAAELLAGAGFADVAEQRAGFDGVRGTFGELREPGWERAGLAVEREEP